MNETRSETVQDLTDEYIDQQIEAALDNPSVHEVSTWKEPNEDQPTDEQAYRSRLEENGPGIIDRLFKAFDLD